MSQRDKVEDEDVEQEQDVFLFREPIVLLTILCLSLSSGLAAAIRDVKRKDPAVESFTEMLSLLHLSATVVSMLGMIFFALLSEIHGRKHIFIIIYTVNIVSLILHLLPTQTTTKLGFIVHGLVEGGSLVMSTLAITEYCCPKHRFTYMMFNTVLGNTIHSLTSIFLTLEPRLYYYVQAFQVVLMLACLASTVKWPESPYWLASKGRLEECHQAFLVLRGEDGRKELDLVMKERRTPGPLKLYWMSFLIAVATISVTVFTSVAGGFRLRWKFGQPTNLITENVILICCSILTAFLVSVLSYFVKRKVLFLLVSSIAFVLSYAICIWIRIDPTLENRDVSNMWFYFLFYISNLISTFGPMKLAVILCIELIPLKYNTHMSCATMLCYYLLYFPFLTFFPQSLMRFGRNNAFLPLFTTLSLVGVIAYYCLAPETKDRTLLEIQKMYTPELSKANSKKDYEMVTHI